MSRTLKQPKSPITPKLFSFLSEPAKVGLKSCFIAFDGKEILRQRCGDLRIFGGIGVFGCFGVPAPPRFSFLFF